MKVFMAIKRRDECRIMNTGADGTRSSVSVGKVVRYASRVCPFGRAVRSPAPCSIVVGFRMTSQH